jgi:hypothetical protein
VFSIVSFAYELLDPGFKKNQLACYAYEKANAVQVAMWRHVDRCGL